MNLAERDTAALLSGLSDEALLNLARQRGIGGGGEAPPDVRGMVAAEATRQGVPVPLATAVAQQESNFRPDARSPAGAIGVMQLMPGTARDLGVDPADPAQNIRGGVTYLKQQLDRFGGDVSKALAAYNAGPGSVQKYGGIPPFPETQAYVRRILRQSSQPAREAPHPLKAELNQRTGSLSEVAQPLVDLVRGVGPLDAARMAVPPIASIPGEMLAMGGTLALTRAAERFTGKAREVGLLQAARGMDAEDAEAIGRDFLLGAGLTGGLRLAGRFLLGPRDVARREAETTLTRTAGVQPPNALAGSPTVNALGRSDSPYTRGEALREYAEGFGSKYLQKPNPEATTAAYDAIGARQIETKSINNALAAIARRAETEGLTDFLPASILRPLPPVASIPDVLARRNGLREVLRYKAGSDRNVSNGLRKLANRTYTQALRAQLNEAEGLALSEAESLARTDAIARTTQDLFETAQDATLGLNGKSLANRLLKGEGDFRDALGDVGYESALSIARAFQTLQQKPNGRPWAQKIARALVGAGLGAAVAPAMGYPASVGAVAGATGLGATSAIPGLFINPWWGKTMEGLARLEPGSRAFLQSAGRLITATLAARQDADQAPEAPPPPLPLPTPARPAPLGAVPLPRPTPHLVRAGMR